MGSPVKPDRKSIYKKYSTQETDVSGVSPRRSIYDKYSISLDTATAVEELPTEERTSQGDFTAGLQSSLRQGVPESVGAFLRTVGLEELGQDISEFGTAGAPNLTGRATSLRDIHSIGDIADFIQFQVGSGVGYLLPSVVGGVAGAAAGSAIPGVGQLIGGIIGAVAPSYILNTGQVQQELEQLGEPDRKGLALLLGVPIAALDAITPSDLANRIVNKQIAKKVAQGLVKKGEAGFAKRAIRTGLKEMGTEATQQVIEEVGARAGTGKPIEPGERAWSALEAGVAGGITGTAVGGFQRAGPKPPSNKSATSTGITPTPEQLIERQAKLNEIVEQTKTREEQKRNEAAVTFTAVRAWSSLTQEQRKASFPGMYDGDYAKAYKDLDDNAKEFLKQAVSVDNNQGRTATPSGETTPPPTPAPVVSPAQVSAGQPVEKTRDDVEAEIAQRRTAREAAVPTTQPDLTSLEQQLEQSIAQRKAARQAELAARDERTRVETARIQSQIQEPAPSSPYADIPKGPPLPDVAATEQSALQEAKAQFEAIPRPVAPVEQKGITEPVTPTIPEETLEETIKNLNDEDLLTNIDGLSVSDPLYHVWAKAAKDRGLSIISTEPSPSADLIEKEKLREGVIYKRTDRKTVDRTVHEILSTSEGEQAIIDRLYSSLIEQHESGIINPENTRLLKNLQAIDVRMNTIKEAESTRRAAKGIPMGITLDPAKAFINRNQEGYIPTVQVIKRAKELAGVDEFEYRIKTMLKDDESDMSIALVTEQTAREIVRDLGQQYNDYVAAGLTHEQAQAGVNAFVAQERIDRQESQAPITPKSEFGGVEGTPIQPTPKPASKPSLEDQLRASIEAAKAKGKPAPKPSPAQAAFAETQKKRATKKPTEAIPQPGLSTGQPAASSEPTTRTAVPSPTPQASPMSDRVAMQGEAPLINEGRLAAEQESLRAQREMAEAVEQEFDRQFAEADAEFAATDDAVKYAAELKRIQALKIEAGKQVSAVKQVAQEAPVKPVMPETLDKQLAKMKKEKLLDAVKLIKAQLANPGIDPETRVILAAELSRVEASLHKRKMNSEGGFLSFPQWKQAKKMAQANMTPSQKYMSEKVAFDPDIHNTWNWIKRIRAFYMSTLRPSAAYQGTFRSTASLNLSARLFEEKTGQTLGAHEHAGKLGEMMDGTPTIAEAWLRGDGPFLPDGQGGFVLTGAQSLAGIGEIAQGEIEEFGWLWAATRALELGAKYGQDIGIDLAHAHEIFLHSPQHLHDAVKAANDYHMSLAQLQFLEGLISQQDIANAAQETSQGPIEHVFDQKLVDLIVQRMQLTGQTAAQVLSTTPIQRIRGTELPTRNMFEATIDVTYRIIRAAKINRFALALVDMAEAQPELFTDMIERVDHKVNIQKQSTNSDRTQVVKALFAQSHIPISDERASVFANLMGDEGLGIKDNILQVKREGKIEFWKVNDLLLDSIRSMSPQEFGSLVRFAGKTAHVLRLGIVLDPMFIAMQTAIDQFQGWTNTRYGFIPVYELFRGWWNLVKNTPMAREAIRAGGVERSSLRVRTTVAEVLAGPNLPPAQQALAHIKTMHPLKAVNDILTPLREATRMGEYIRAREHGASPIEAAWAARDLLGNYSVSGSFSTVRALHIMSAFSRPAFAVADKTARTIKERPAQWFLRASTLAIGTMILYAANDDDDEIQQLRQTPDGQRWFFFRVGNEIMKWRKPYLEGAIFASGMEAALDKMKGENPEAFKLWRKSMLQELGLNMLPVMGVAAAELWANKSLRTGAPIIPEYEKGLDPEYQVGPYSGTFERSVGELGGVSPAIINYLTRGFLGYWGEHFTRGVSAAMDWNATHELPPAADWPLTQRILARYPSSNTQAVKEFYENAEDIDRAAKTLEFTYNHRPDRIEAELQQHEAQLPLIEIYNDYRQQIADLRESMGQLDDIKDIGPSTKRAYRDEFLRVIIELAKSANEVTRAIKEATSQTPNINSSQMATPTPRQ